jgi:hypothetical protein
MKARNLRLFDQFQQMFWIYQRDYTIEYFGFQDYLDALDTKERITFCRFRTCNCRLGIETGRWQNIERYMYENNAFINDKNDLIIF